MVLPKEGGASTYMLYIKIYKNILYVNIELPFWNGKE
jgi:hypothetical protein